MWMAGIANTAALLSLFFLATLVESRSCQLKDVVFNDDDDGSPADIPQDCTELYLFNAEGTNTVWSADSRSPRGGAEGVEVVHRDDGMGKPLKNRKEDQIALALPLLIHLERLVCHSVHFGDFGAPYIAKLIGGHAASALTHVHLRDAGITDKGAAVLGKALETADHLEVLSLADNRIADEGAAVIAEALQVNMALKTLDLSRNLLSDHAAAAVADSLAVSGVTSALTDLDLSYNAAIGDAAASSLAYMLQKNNVLASIMMLGNNITEVGIITMNSALVENTALTRLEIDGSAVKEYDFDAWAAMRSVLRKRRHGACGSADVFRSSSISTEAKGMQPAFATWAASIPWDCVTVDLSEHPVQPDTVKSLSLAAISIANTLATMFPKIDKEQKMQQRGKVPVPAPVLQKLDLRFCNFGNTGASMLANAFHKLGPSKIDYIDLRNNNIDNVSALSMITAISTNMDLLLTLKVLYIRDDENVMVDNPHPYKQHDPQEL